MPRCRASSSHTLDAEVALSSFTPSRCLLSRRVRPARALAKTRFWGILCRMPATARRLRYDSDMTQLNLVFDTCTAWGVQGSARWFGSVVVSSDHSTSSSDRLQGSAGVFTRCGTANNSSSYKASKCRPPAPAASCKGKMWEFALSNCSD